MVNRLSRIPLVRIYFQSFSGLSREIWLLSLVMLINRSGAMVLPFMSIYLNQALGYSLYDCGIIMACFGLGSVSGSFIGGVLTDKFGFYRVMLFSLLISSVSFLIVVHLKTFILLCIGFFAISFIADTFRPANLTAIEAFSKQGNTTRSLSLVRMAINLGYAIGPFLGGYVAHLLGYDLLFIINAGSVFLAFLVFYSFFKNKKKRSLDKDEVDFRIPDDAIAPWKNMPYLAYLAALTTVIVVFFHLIYTIPVFFKTVFGFNESHIGLLMALSGMTIVVFEMPIIFKTENRFRAEFMVFVGGLLIALGFLSLSLIKVVVLSAVLYILFISFGEIISFPFSNTVALTFSQSHNRGKYMGLYTMAFSVAHVITPILGMSFADRFGFHTMWGYSGILCIVASVGILYIKKRKAQV